MTTTPPQGAQSADPVRDLIDKIKAACREKPTALNGYGLKLWEQIESALRTALAAPEGPAPTGWQTVSDEVVQSVADDLQREFGLTYGILSKCTLGSMLVDALRLSVSVTSARAPEAPPPVEVRQPQQEPDCWAILTPNGSMLVSPDEAKGRKGAYPLYRAPEAPPPVEARQPPQSELAKSLAWSNDDGWRAQRLATEFHEIYERLAPIFGYETRPDTKQFDPNSKNGKLMIAVCGNILAALAAPAGAIQPPLDHQVGAQVTPLPLESAGGAPSATAEPRE